MTVNEVWLNKLEAIFKEHAVEPYKLDSKGFIGVLDERIKEYVSTLMPTIIECIRNDKLPVYPNLPALTAQYPRRLILTEASAKIIELFIFRFYRITLKLSPQWMMTEDDELYPKLFGDINLSQEVTIFWKVKHIKKYSLQVGLNPQQTDLHKTLMQLLYPNLNDTITFKVYRTNPSSHQLITIHRNLVQFFSDTLMCRAREEMADEKKVFEIDDEDPEYFELLKEFFYLAELKASDISTLFNLYVIADKYLINNLKNYIIKNKFYEYLQSNILDEQTIQDYIILLQLALTYDIKEIISCILKRAEQSNQYKTLIKKTKNNNEILLDFANELHLPNVKEFLKRRSNVSS